MSTRGGFGTVSGDKVRILLQPGSHSRSCKPSQGGPSRGTPGQIACRDRQAWFYHLLLSHPGSHYTRYLCTYLVLKSLQSPPAGDHPERAGVHRAKPPWELTSLGLLESLRSPLGGPSRGLCTYCVPPDKSSRRPGRNRGMSS